MTFNLPEIEVELRMQRSLFDGYRPHLQVDEGEYLGVSFFDVSSDISPGDQHRVKAHLVYWPSVDYSPLKVGAEFKVREGANTVGVGVVIHGWSLMMSNPSIKRTPDGVA